MFAVIFRLHHRVLAEQKRSVWFGHELEHDRYRDEARVPVDQRWRG